MPQIGTSRGFTEGVKESKFCSQLFCPSYCQVCDIFGRRGKFHQRKPILKNFSEGEKPILKIETLNPLSRVLLNATHSLVENKILINVNVQNFML